MKFPAISIILGMCFVLISNVGLADWQYTKWGMKVDEVIIASDGKAKEFVDSGRDSDTARTLATAPYVAGDFLFEANFMFDRKTQKLRHVKLTLKKDNGGSLYAALVNRYGKPVSELETAVLRSARWLDRENNNNVNWLMIGESHTSIDYSAMIAKSEKGL